MEQGKPGRAKGGQCLPLIKGFILGVGLLVAGYACADSNNDNTSLTGVWAGSMGSKTVMVCFTHRGPEPGFGLLYDRESLTLSQLTPGNGSNAANGSVPTSWSDGQGTWSLDAVSSEQITGQWTQAGGGASAIALTRMPAATDRDSTSPCASRAFNEPTESQPTLSAGLPQEVDGLHYRIITLNAGRADEAASANGLHIDTLELLGDDPAISRINTLLRRRLPDSQASVLDRLYNCRRRERDADGQEGVASERVTEVHLVKGRWLTVQTDDNSNCAAPRTANWANHYTFDLQTGQPVNLMTWFRNTPASDNPEGQAPGEYPQQLPPALKALVLAGISPDRLQACPDLGNPDAGYIPHISENGMRFSFPGSVQGICASEVLIPFEQIQPLLSDEGRNQIKVLLASNRERPTASR